MEIEVGKFYRTISGEKVRIYATDGEDSCPVHGAILIPSKGWSLYHWAKDGGSTTGSRGIYDIVGEWENSLHMNPRYK